MAPRVGNATPRQLLIIAMMAAIQETLTIPRIRRLTEGNESRWGHH